MNQQNILAQGIVQTLGQEEKYLLHLLPKYIVINLGSSQNLLAHSQFKRLHISWTL